MSLNNSSGFNGRRVAGTERWSWHAHGRAVDFNPVQNPWVYQGKVHPEKGESYVFDRFELPKNRVETKHPALLTATHPVVKAFESLGWEWGGHWKEYGPDNHHFHKRL